MKKLESLQNSKKEVAKCKKMVELNRRMLKTILGGQNGDPLYGLGVQYGPSQPGDSVLGNPCSGCSIHPCPDRIW